MPIRKYRIEKTSWENSFQIRITGIENQGQADKVILALENAEVVFDRVFIEIERVYECLYDCLIGRREAAL